MFEIGTSLREARLRRRVEFAEAEQATKVRVKYLRALEDEQFELLPSQTYVKGFLRTYADYLGLDGQLYVDEYNSRFVAGEEDYRPRHSSVRPQRRHRRIEANGVLVTVAVVAVVTVGVIAAWTSSGGDRTTATTAAASTAAATPPARAVPPLLAIRAVRGPSKSSSTTPRPPDDSATRARSSAARRSSSAVGCSGSSSTRPRTSSCRFVERRSSRCAGTGRA